MTYTLILAGPPLPLDGAYITELAFGNRERTVQMPMFLPGAYAESSSGAALWNYAKTKMYWKQTAARCVRFGITAYGVSAGNNPYVNMFTDGYVSTDNSGSGLLVASVAGDLTWTSYTIDPDHYLVEFGDALEIAIISQDNSADDEYLTVFSVWVLE